MGKKNIIALIIIFICILTIINIWRINRKTLSKSPSGFSKRGDINAGKEDGVPHVPDLNAFDKRHLSEKSKYYRDSNMDDSFDPKRKKPRLNDSVMEELIEREEIQGEEKYPIHARFFDLDMGKAFRYDVEKGILGEISYNLEEPSRVAIRVMARNTRELCLRTITDWEIQNEGFNTVTWDGRDSSGNILDPKRIIIRTRAEPLTTYNPGTMPIEDLTIEELVFGHIYGHKHNEHHEYACKDMKVDILKIMKDDVLNGKRLIEGQIDPQRRGYGDIYGYGVRYYVDYTLVHEDFYKPGSNGKFSYELDTTAFENGEHIISVGTCDHNDHVGSANVKVSFNN